MYAIDLFKKYSVSNFKYKMQIFKLVKVKGWKKKSLQH